MADKHITEALRVALESAQESEQKMRTAAAMVMRGLERRQREFAADKKRIEDDIRRGSRLSKGRIPF